MRFGIALAALVLFAGCSRPAVKDARHVETTPPETAAAVKKTSRPSLKVWTPSEMLAAEDPIVEKIVTAMEGGEYSKARHLAESSLPSSKTPVRGRLLWLAAQASLEVGSKTAAIQYLAKLSSSSHPLSRWATLKHAQLIEYTDPAKASAEAARINDDWSGGHAARTLQARALVRAGKPNDAIPRLRKLVQQAPRHVGGASAAIPLAKLLEKRGDTKSLLEALELYRRVASRAPLAAVGKDAQKRADALLERLPSASKKKKATPRAHDRFAQANALYNSQRYKKAEAAFGRLARSLPHASALRCESRLMQGKAMLKQRKRPEGSSLLVQVAEVCSEDDVKAWSRFLGGRALGRIGKWKAAVEQYRLLQKETPKHSLADDAAFRSAKVQLELGSPKKAKKELAAIPKLYPNGDMWQPALFRLAWEAHEDRDYKNALKHFTDLVERGEVHDDEARVGQASYWRARTLSNLKKDKVAIEAYRDLALKWPLRYYAQLALARLKLAAPKEAEKIIEQMQGDDSSNALKLKWRPEFEDPAFDRAVELLKVGDTQRAMIEFRSLGMLGSGADPDLALAAATLLQQAEDEPVLSRVIRNHFRRFSGLLPKGDARSIWKLVYPKAFSPQIEWAAKRESLPPSFVRAIAREESSFDPNAESWAKAYGLVQLILPTAKRFGKEVKVRRVTPRTLKNPKINLKIGTRYMAWLWKRHPETAAFVVSAYNAGEGALRGWLKEKKYNSMDEFVESIPYDETRRYTRRVLQSYGVYSWLYEKKLPDIPFSLVP